jgi:thioredoxin
VDNRVLFLDIPFVLKNKKYIKMKYLFSLLFLFSIALPAQIRTVSIEEFEKQLYATKAEQLIDVRTPQEFAKYRIESAKNFDFKSPDFKKEIEKLDKEKPVLVYCLAGVRSKACLETFREAGFKTVYELEGGLNAWSKLGKPVIEDLSGKGELSSKDFDAIISEKGYILVDFYAPWCAPCRKMLPMIEELEKTYKNRFKLLTVDFDQNRLLAKDKQIRAVPYLMIFKDGKKIWERQGEATREELMEILKLK